MYLRLKYFAVICALAFTLSVAFERRAYAYVDPGSGLLLLQSLSAMVTGALFYLRKRIKALIFRSRLEKSLPAGNQK